MNRIVVTACLGAMLAGCSDNGGSGIPGDYVSIGERGYHAPVGVAAAAGNQVYWVKDILSGWSELAPEDRPGSIKYLKSISGCDFSKPGSDDLVVNVMVDQAAEKAPVFASSNDGIKAAANAYVEAVKKDGLSAPVPVNSTADQLGLVDVIVTEKKKPVYLVLAHTDGVIFNLHPAEGANVSHIVLLGFGPDGVVNSGSIPIESLNGNQMIDCKILPSRAPASYWKLVKDAADKSELQQDVSTAKQRAEQYAGWFNKSFGADSESAMVGLSEGSHFLVGPAPSDSDLRVVYNPFSGATVNMTARDVLFTGTAETYSEKKKSLIVQEATAAAGGDLSKLAQQ